MALSSRELARAREITESLLDALPLRNYFYEIEPGEAGWQLRLNCATAEGWANYRIPVERGRLLASGEDDGVRAALVQEWRRTING